MDPKLSPGLCIATKCSIVDPLGPLFYMNTKKLSYFAFRSLGTLVSFHSYLHRGLDQIFVEHSAHIHNGIKKIVDSLYIHVYTIFSTKTKPLFPSYFLLKLSITYVNNQMRLHTKVDLMPDA